MGASRYDLYLDTVATIEYVSRYVSKYSKMPEGRLSSMKAETPVIRSTAHNLLLQWIEYLPLQLPLVEPKRDFTELYQSISINLIIKKHVF